jgi:hypothetical protein
MNEQTSRHEPHPWEGLTPTQVLATVVQELYNPVSLLGRHLNRLTGEEDPLTEEEYESLFEQMDGAVRQLSKTIVSMKRYAREHGADVEDLG